MINKATRRGRKRGVERRGKLKLQKEDGAKRKEGAKDKDERMEKGGSGGGGGGRLHTSAPLTSVWPKKWK